MRGTPNKSLSYDEMLFLSLYEKYLGTRYQLREDNRDRDNISRDHIQAQKIGYTLTLQGILNKYCFSWNRRGPFSSKFQEMLIGLDSRPELLESYYNNDAQKALTELLPECILTTVHETSDGLNKYMSENKDEDALELLGSLLYIGTTVLPGQDFAQVNAELQWRKSTFNDISKNYLAWEYLHELNLIT